MKELLLIEDDLSIAENIVGLLTEEGFRVCRAASKAEALRVWESDSFDLVLLDLMLPDGSGYSLCSAIRHNGSTPIIILTAMNDEASIVTGFDLGADDYITKPFKPMELVARVRNALRRAGKAPAVLEVGPLKIDTLKAAVTKGEAELALSALEYRLLLVLISHRGEVLPRSRLLEEIWDIAGDFVNDNTLTVYIKRLRDKIEDDPARPVLLKTVRGLGYVLGG